MVTQLGVELMTTRCLVVALITKLLGHSTAPSPQYRRRADNALVRSGAFARRAGIPRFDVVCQGAPENARPEVMYQASKPGGPSREKKPAVFCWKLLGGGFGPARGCAAGRCLCWAVLFCVFYGK